jgi:hypothetical protein
MDVKTETTKTYWLGMTEHQARDLLSIAMVHELKYTDSEEETLDTVRQTLLATGLKRNET